MKSANHHHLYGICVRSPWPLPCPASDEPHPISIDLSESTEPLVDSVQINSAPNQYSCFEDGTTYLRWPGPTEFLVSGDGRRIVARLHSSASFETLQAVLFGGVFSVALLRMGFEQLHATAVVEGNTAAVFMGDTGAGKSSLATALLRKGCRLLTDDLLVIERQEDVFIARPGLPRIKLCDDSADSIATQSLGHEVTINGFTGKRVVRLHDRHFFNTNAQVPVFYALSPEDADSKISLEPLSPQEAFVEICRGTFNSYLTDEARLRNQFSLAGALAAGVVVRRLRFPRNFAALPTVCDTILADLDLCRKP